MCKILDDIALATTYIEAGGNYRGYCDLYKTFGVDPSRGDWLKVCKQYMKFSLSFTDEELLKLSKFSLENY
jgi:hypothetical protein